MGGTLDGGGTVAGRTPLSEGSFGRASLLASVGSGVYSDRRGLTTFSRLLTFSLLWAFEKLGYGRLDFDSWGEAPDARRSISGTTEDILRDEAGEFDLR